jgi:nitric oxide reductase large subunit
MNISQWTGSQWTSLGAGAVVGLIAAVIFAVILRRLEKEKPQDALRALYKLVSLVFGGGVVDMVVFDFILRADAIVFYLAGLVSVFLPLGMSVWIDWTRRS